MPRAATANNQTDLLGGKITFFRSIGNHKSHQCLVIAHGGLFPTTRPATFVVPADTTIYFGARHGFPNHSGVSAEISLNQQKRKRREAIDAGKGQRSDFVYPPGTNCFNYSLKKFVGGHGVPSSYLDIRDHMQEKVDDWGPANEKSWVPHVVSIRNPGIGIKTVLLSEVVDSVRDYAGPFVSKFYCSNCRNSTNNYLKALKAMLIAQ